MNKRVLLVAFHFPPASGSSGVHRAHTLAKFLPEFGWEPIVLTAHPRAYPTTSPSGLDDIPASSLIFRAQAFDSARHMSIRGGYPDFIAWPDRWVTWYPGAVLKAMQLVRTYRPQLIWSTYPIATATLVGLTVNRLSRLPWVADLRDSMTDEEFPVDKRKRRIYRWIEAKAAARAARVVFTAPGTREMYASRFRSIPKCRWHVILNGFDEEAFTRAEALPSSAIPERGGKVVLLHSGVIYPKERNPSALFQAIADLKQKGVLTATSFELRLRSTGHDNQLLPSLKTLDILDIVSLLPSLPYDNALAEMLNVDGLILLQASSCNHQIPAKAYEYARARRPILALTDEKGDTAWLLAQLGNYSVAPLDSASQISEALVSFLDQLRKEPRHHSRSLDSYSRQVQARRTAEMFDEIVNEM